MRKAISSGQLLNASTCVLIERASHGVVTRKDLNLEDWQDIWPNSPPSKSRMTIRKTWMPRWRSWDNSAVKPGFRNHYLCGVQGRTAMERLVGAALAVRGGALFDGQHFNATRNCCRAAELDRAGVACDGGEIMSQALAMFALPKAKAN